MLSLLLVKAALTVLLLECHTSSAQDTSSNSSLRVKDYDLEGQLPNGTSKPLYTLTWRAVGIAFAANNFQLNTTFTSHANTAFEQAPHKMIYTAVNIRDAAAFQTSRSLNGNTVNQLVDASAQGKYSSVDLLMRATFSRDSVWDDLGVTQQPMRQSISSTLGRFGWNMTAVIPMVLEIAPEAAPLLQRMPLPSYSSYQVVLQVAGANLVPTTLQSQNLITESLLDLLYSDHVFLIRLTHIEEMSPVNGIGTAKMTYIMQKNSETISISSALQLVLGNVATAGSQLASSFSVMLRNNGLKAIASVVSETQVSNDSIGDQIDALTKKTNGSEARRHLGAIIGSTVGSGVALLILLAVFAAYGRGWLKSRQLREQAAAAPKSDAASDVEEGRPGLHDSGSSLANQSGSGLAVQSQAAAAAMCWDIDASDIGLCYNSDGSDCLLSSTESGQVYKAVKGGVQDVAVKVLNNGDSELATQDLRKEVDILKSVSYDRNVVQFYGTCPWGDKTMLVLEYMEGGDLRQALTNSRNGEMKWQNKGSTIALDIVRGLHYLHSHGVMHMDLKASNVLLTQTYSIAKIGDVGFAQVMGSSRAGRPRPATFAYSAPELILNGACTEKVDMYSFGVILWELITTEVARRGRLRAIEVPMECPAEVEQLIDMCLATDPSERPTAKQAFDIISSCAVPAASALPASAPSQPTPSVQDPPPAYQSEGDGAASHQQQQLQQNLQMISPPEDAGQKIPATPPQPQLLPPKDDRQLSHMANGHSQPEVVLSAGSATSNQSAQAQTGIPGLREQHQLHSNITAGDEGTGAQAPPWLDSGQLVGIQNAADTMPTGVYGHLYPSPFAAAVDASSGPLWDWQQAPAL